MLENATSDVRTGRATIAIDGMKDHLDDQVKNLVGTTKLTKVELDEIKSFLANKIEEMRDRNDITREVVHET